METGAPEVVAWGEPKTGLCAGVGPCVAAVGLDMAAVEGWCGICETAAWWGGIINGCDVRVCGCGDGCVAYGDGCTGLIEG